MIGSLRTRLLGSMLVVTTLVVGTTMLVADPLLEERARRDVREDLEAIVAHVVQALEAGEAPAQAGPRIAAQHAAQVAIYAPDGAVLTQSRPGNALSAHQLEHARRGEPVIDSEPDAHGRRWMFRTATLEGRVVQVGRPLPPMASARSALRQVLLLAGLFAMLAAALLGELLGRAIGRPIREMTETADALRRGDLSTRVRSRRTDELGSLGSAIDQMADQLVERFEEVRREEERLRTILDAMVEGVMVTDPDGRIVLTNAALVRLAGGRAEGRTAVEAIRSAELHEAVRAGLEGRATEVDFELSVGGRRRSIAAQTSPMPGRGGVVAVLHDVTQLKRADAVRRDFVANASHELRTPLTAIRGFAETLRDGALHDERMATRFLANIADNASRLQGLVEDLLELSRAESPDSEVELAPLDLLEAAARALHGLERRAAEKGQQLELDGAVSVTALGDARAIDHVLLNLVDNAIKYTPDGGRVTVAARAEGDRAVLEVRDTGPGIPHPHVDRIFERFYRVDKGRSRAQGGTGLGLSIVRHLVGRMGGEITVDSWVGEGTTFRVALPRPAEAAEAAEASSAAPPAPRVADAASAQR
ncbi:MAG TPA: ATP-binding protein [Sandaracinaceae bacterium LLY-WYZ-13_1]|nr:ATP-binding protein [Sandaracinaceae bacterium LLY-WYZ-13_1]